tara:strand:+ start:8230 stop:8697 length:468 start_codon:yes stop_codon:yes gene_type:complete
MMIRSILVLTAATALSACGSASPSCEGPDPRSIVKALDAQGLVGASVMDIAPSTMAEFQARSGEPGSFADRLESSLNKVIDLDDSQLEDALVAGYEKVDPAARAAMCDALNGNSRETIMQVNAQLAPILGPEAMPIVEAAGADLLRVLDQGDAGE